jgi:4-hydroxy-tetrahydrodipicolinate synthase
MFDAAERGDLAAARRINATLVPSFDFETGDDAPNPIPTKALLGVLGLRVGECRPPMGPAPDGLATRARAVLDGLG